MPLTTAAEALEELAQGRLPERRRLSHATAVLIARYRTALLRERPDQGVLFHALGLLNHAIGGALPSFSERGRTRALRLATDVRRMALADARLSEPPPPLPSSRANSRS